MYKIARWKPVVWNFVKFAVLGDFDEKYMLFCEK
jgi:hypothetical protein